MVIVFYRSLGILNMLLKTVHLSYIYIYACSQPVLTWRRLALYGSFGSQSGMGLGSATEIRWYGFEISFLI